MHGNYKLEECDLSEPLILYGIWRADPSFVRSVTENSAAKSKFPRPGLALLVRFDGIDGIVMRRRTKPQ